MSQKQYPKYDPQDVKKWLTAVFGKDIIFDTQRAKSFRSSDEDDSLGAWRIYYTGEVFLQADLPPDAPQILAASLRDRLNNAIVSKLLPESWRASRAERAKALRDSDWPQPDDVIDSGLRIDTALLKILAERMDKPVDYASAFAGEVKAFETAWIERKQKLTRRCAVALIGREPSDDDRWQFSYDDIRNWGGRMELAFQLPASYPPVFPTDAKLTSSWERSRKWEDHWAKRSLELGLSGAFRYSDFHYGTHAPIEEQKLVLHGRNDFEISNKVDDILDPKQLPATQAYFNEVLGTTLINIWFDNQEHPEMRSLLRTAWDRLEKQGTAVDDPVWDKTYDALEKSDKFRQWAEIVPALMERHQTTAAFIEAAHGAAPQGQDEIYTYLRAWSARTFPLLTKAILGRAAAPAPAQKWTAPGPD